MICVIFDLDGTLTDSREGILKSIEHALTTMNHPIPDEATLQLFIGPPLADSFKEHCHMSDEEVEMAYNLFKERYDSIGKYENALYPQIEEALKALRKTGAYVGIATAKPEEQAKDIIKHFKLDPYFEVIRGANREAGLVHKLDILKEALQDLNKITELKYKISRWYMVGDRKYDMEAAKELNCVAMGVSYGYGSLEELESAGADYICESPSDVLVNIAVDTLL